MRSYSFKRAKIESDTFGAFKSSKLHFFSSKISRLFDFQISKLARLKTVTKTRALTCAIRFYDPKQAYPIVSSHSDEFGALLNEKPSKAYVFPSFSSENH